MADDRIALVTGANQGIGLQIAKDLAAKGLTVLVGARNHAKGEAAAQEIGEQAHAIQIDVTDQASIDAAAARIRGEFGRLDVLMNNAGISHAGRPGRQFENLGDVNSLVTAPLEDVRTVFETNVFGVIAVTQAMLPLLRESPAGRIVITASSGGSLTLNSDPANPHRAMFGNYSVSKAAVHAVMLAFAIPLEGTNIKVNAACPGFTGTALNNFRGTRSVEEGARQPVRLALIGEDGPTGTFWDENGPFRGDRHPPRHFSHGRRMRIFLTGATGFVGSAIVPDLVAAGHQVVGLARSEEAVRTLAMAGAEAHRGDLNDLESLRAGAAATDGVIHAAFDHDFARLVESCEMDRLAIEAIGDALARSDKRFIVTSGLPPMFGRVATEDDLPPADGHGMPRRSEQATRALLERSVQAMVIRMPQVHDRAKQGFATYVLAHAREKGLSAYVGDGANRWPAVHRLDAARL